jgi:hypothetical protein
MRKLMATALCFLVPLFVAYLGPQLPWFVFATSPYCQSCCPEVSNPRIEFLSHSFGSPTYDIEVYQDPSTGKVAYGFEFWEHAAAASVSCEFCGKIGWVQELKGLCWEYYPAKCTNNAPDCDCENTTYYRGDSTERVDMACTPSANCALTPGQICPWYGDLVDVGEECGQTTGPIEVKIDDHISTSTGYNDIPKTEFLCQAGWEVDGTVHLVCENESKARMGYATFYQGFEGAYTPSDCPPVSMGAYRPSSGDYSIIDNSYKSSWTDTECEIICVSSSQDTPFDCDCSLGSACKQAFCDSPKETGAVCGQCTLQ